MLQVKFSETDQNLSKSPVLTNQITEKKKDSWIIQDPEWDKIVHFEVNDNIFHKNCFAVSGLPWATLVLKWVSNKLRESLSLNNYIMMVTAVFHIERILLEA